MTDWHDEHSGGAFTHLDWPTKSLIPNSQIGILLENCGTYLKQAVNCEGRHPPNLDQLTNSLNIAVAYIQEPVQSIPNPIPAVIGAGGGATLLGRLQSKGTSFGPSQLELKPSLEPQTVPTVQALSPG